MLLTTHSSPCRKLSHLLGPPTPQACRTLWSKITPKLRIGEVGVNVRNDVESMLLVLNCAHNIIKASFDRRMLPVTNF